MDKPTQPTNPLSMPFQCFLRDSRVDRLPIQEHRHYFAEMILVKEGVLRVRRDGTVHDLTPGAFLFILPLMRHAVERGDDEPVVYETIRMDMEQLGELPSYSPDLRSIMLDAARENMPMEFTPEEIHREHIDFMFHECVKEYQDRPYGYDLRICSILYLITVSLARLWIGKGYQPKAQSLQIDPLFTVTAYISRHINEPLKVEDLAAHCGLSYPWFARRFREIYSSATGRSVLLLNETFSTTSFEEGYYIAVDAVRAILKKDARTIYNTHMHKLAKELDTDINESGVSGKAVSLTAETVDGRSTFRVRVAPPEGKSYARGIAEKYGVTYEDLTGGT